jgi:hypothetical protein
MEGHKNVPNHPPEYKKKPPEIKHGCLGNPELTGGFNGKIIYKKGIFHSQV